MCLLFASSEDMNIKEITLNTLKGNKERSINNPNISGTVLSTHNNPTQSTSGPTTAVRYLPSARDLTEAGPTCSFSEKFGHVSPQNIQPKPKKNLTNKGPKPMKCAVVISSSYKHALEEADRKKNGDVNKS